MALDELTITLIDPDGRVSVETLAKALEDSLDMLRNISSDVVASGVNVKWEVVRAQMRSPLKLTLAPRITGTRSRSVVKKQVVSACINGVKSIESAAIMPPHFNEHALEAAKRLAKRNDDTTLTFSSNGKNKVTLTDDTVKHIDEIASKARHYVDFTTIEGHLEVVTIHQKLGFSIWEILTNNEIKCNADDEQFDLALALLKQRPRVAVTGRVHYKNHVPKSIDVDSVTILRNTDKLPQPKDIGPINITDGLSSEEHVRRMRNA